MENYLGPRRQGKQPQSRTAGASEHNYRHSYRLQGCSQKLKCPNRSSCKRFLLEDHAGGWVLAIQEEDATVPS